MHTTKRGGIIKTSVHGAIRKNNVIAGNIVPTGLAGNSGAKIETNPNIGVVRARDRDRLKLGRVLDLVDERTIAESLLGHVLSGRIVGHIPGDSSGDRSANCFPNARAADHKMTTTAAGPGGIAIVAAGNSPMKDIVRQNK